MIRRTAAVLLILLLAGCLIPAAAAAEDTREFTDDLGRTVIIPADIEKVIPSGHLALSVLLSYDPSYLASCAAGLPKNAEKYLPAFSALNLPKTGSAFYASGNINYEEVLKLSKKGADIFIDVGQKLDVIPETLDEFTRISGMPAVFISQNSLEEIPDSYLKIGQVLGDTKRSEELYSYLKNWVDTFRDGMKSVKKVTAAQINMIDGNTYYLLGGPKEDGSLGYQSLALSTFADNVVTAKTNKGLGDIYGMEEVLNLFTEKDPDCIFIAGSPDHRYYTEFLSNPAFSNLSAVKNGYVYEIPNDCPYLWTAQPFSGWGICGMICIANLLYPETFSYNAKEKIQEFYRVMIGYNLTDEEYDELTQVKKTASTPLLPAGIIAGLFAACLLLRRR